MRIGLTSLLANHFHDQSHVATQVTPNLQPESRVRPTPKGKKHAFAVVQSTLKRIQRTWFFLQNCPFATYLVAFPLGSDVVVRKLFVPLVISSPLKNQSFDIPLLPILPLPKTVNAP